MKICRILKIIILICFMLLILSSKVFALSGWFDQAENFIQTGTVIIGTRSYNEYNNIS